jgi:hypothetical protein
LTSTQRYLVLAATGLLAVCGAFVSYRAIEGRLAQLETAPRVDPRELSELKSRIAEQGQRVASALAELDRLRNTPARTAELDERIARLANELDDTACSLAVQDEKLSAWEAVREEIGPAAVDARLAGYRDGVDSQMRRVDELARTALGLAEGARSELDRVEQDLDRDPGRMWRELVGPTVQLMGEDTVGSGVLLQSQRVDGTDEYRTYLITAWHVVRDIQASAESLAAPVPVTIYTPDKSFTAETATLLEHDAEIDAALLVLRTTRAIECGAKLASRERLASARIFDRIYAVGCPLGNDPIPTYGEVADTHHVVDGQRYWMISAPTYIGNSGGGIFDARTHELLGIFSKIYTHGSVRPTVVPHMGLATSLTAIYDWLDKVGYASLEPASVTPQTASAKR